MGRAYRHIATRRADTWVRPYVYYGAGLQTHRDPAGGHVGPPLRLLWGGPIDTSRPGGRTRGSAPTSTMGQAYRHIATRLADTWVRPNVNYGAGLQTHRDPAGGHVGPPLRQLWGRPTDTSRPGGRTRGSAPYVYYGAGLQTHRDPAGGHVGPPLRLLWGGPIDTSRPGGRTRGSAPTPIMLMIAEQLPARAALDPDRGHRYSVPQIHRTQGGGEIP